MLCSIVNFEKGNALVEIAVDPNANQEEIDEKLTEAIYNLMVSRGSTCPYRSQVDQSKPITQNPILDGLLDLSDYHIDLSSENNLKSVRKKTRPWQESNWTRKKKGKKKLYFRKVKRCKISTINPRKTLPTK